jgi:pimeloyl-ACP methyl ester carboxylesterase
MKKRIPASLVCVLHLAASQDAMADRSPLRKASLDGVALEYEARGSGEPVVLIHAGIFADWFQPLLDETALTGRYRVVSYHRVGYAGSSHPAGPISIAQQAAHLRMLMRHLGISKAHLVGHSSGGNIALQLALDAPGMVQSIALLEPALPVSTPGGQKMLSRQSPMAPVLAAYRAGDKPGAVDGFMRVVSGPDYRPVVERALPAGFAQAVADADTFFGQELPALLAWSLPRENAARIAQPVLSIVGARSLDLNPIWRQRHEMVLSWLPRAEGLILVDATHLLPIQQPRSLAAALAAFFARHPLP